MKKKSDISGNVPEGTRRRFNTIRKQRVKMARDKIMMNGEF